MHASGWGNPSSMANWDHDDDIAQLINTNRPDGNNICLVVRKTTGYGILMGVGLSLLVLATSA
jgi:hypothetical protein